MTDLAVILNCPRTPLARRNNGSKAPRALAAWGKYMLTGGRDGREASECPERVAGLNAAPAARCRIRHESPGPQVATARGQTNARGQERAAARRHPGGGAGGVLGARVCGGAAGG